VLGDERDQRGSAAVEFALLLPIALLLLLAFVQVGVLATDQLLLTQASRAGAREAAVQPSEEAVVDAVRAAAAGLDGERIEVDVAWSGQRGDPVTVSLAYDVPTAAALAGWLLPDAVTLRATATMRQEFS
jgi:Flp pilus assembly protein TadG